MEQLAVYRDLLLAPLQGRHMSAPGLSYSRTKGHDKEKETLCRRRSVFILLVPERTGLCVCVCHLLVVNQHSAR